MFFSEYPHKVFAAMRDTSTKNERESKEIEDFISKAQALLPVTGGQIETWLMEKPVHGLKMPGKIGAEVFFGYAEVNGKWTFAIQMIERDEQDGNRLIAKKVIALTSASIEIQACAVPCLWKLLDAIYQKARDYHINTGSKATEAVWEFRSYLNAATEALAQEKKTS